MASSCTIKLVGPDLPVDGLKCVIELTGNIGQLRASAYAQLPPPTGGATPPRLEQVRVIHQGRFLPDEKLIKEFRVEEGGTMAMHLVIKSAEAKKPHAPAAGDEKQAKCGCVIC